MSENLAQDLVRFSYSCPVVHERMIGKQYASQMKVEMQADDIKNTKVRSKNGNVIILAYFE